MRSRSLVSCLLAGQLLAFGGVQAHAAGELVLYNWADYFPPELLQKFEAETGIKVFTEFYESNEVLLANLQAGTGNYDVVVPSDYMMKILIDEGLVQPIEANAMANFVNVKPPFDDAWFDPGRRYSVPNMWGTTGFLYDPSQVAGGSLEESWREFFEPRPELAGRIVALDDRRELYQSAAYYLAIDPCTEDPQEAQRILDLLLAQKPNLAFYTTGTNPAVEDPVGFAAELLNSGEVVMLQGWDGSARLIQRLLPEVIYVVPREGSAFWQDAYAVPTNAWNPDNAKLFLDWLMQPENMAAVSNYAGYTNAIAGSERFMEASLAADQRTGLSSAHSARLRQVLSCSPAARELNEKVWARLWPRTVK